MSTRPVTAIGKRVAVLARHLIGESKKSKAQLAADTGVPLPRVQQAARDGAVSHEALMQLFPHVRWFARGRLVKPGVHAVKLTLAAEKKYSALTGDAMDLTITSRIAVLRPLGRDLLLLLSAEDLDGAIALHEAMGKLMSI